MAAFAALIPAIASSNTTSSSLNTRARILIPPSMNKVDLNSEAILERAYGLTMNIHPTLFTNHRTPEAFERAAQTSDLLRYELQRFKRAASNAICAGVSQEDHISLIDAEKSDMFWTSKEERKKLLAIRAALDREEEKTEKRENERDRKEWLELSKERDEEAKRRRAREADGTERILVVQRELGERKPVEREEVKEKAKTIGALACESYNKLMALHKKCGHDKKASKREIEAKKKADEEKAKALKKAAKEETKEKKRVEDEDIKTRKRLEEVQTKSNMALEADEKKAEKRQEDEKKKTQKRLEENEKKRQKGDKVYEKKRKELCADDSEYQLPTVDGSMAGAVLDGHRSQNKSLWGRITKPKM